MVKVTYGELNRLRLSSIDRTGSPLVHLRLTDRETSIVDRIRIGRLVEKLTKAVADYERDLQTVADDCGGQRSRENPANTKIPDDRMEEWTHKVRDLHLTEVEVDVVPLPLSALEHAPLTVDDLDALRTFIVFPSEK